MNDKTTSQRPISQPPPLQTRAREAQFKLADFHTFRAAWKSLGE